MLPSRADPFGKSRASWAGPPWPESYAGGRGAAVRYRQGGFSGYQETTIELDNVVQGVRHADQAERWAADDGRPPWTGRGKAAADRAGDHAQAFPPDGESWQWWQRLKNAFGTASSAFVDASLFQLIAAARLPGSGAVPQVAVNAALALIQSTKPRDEIECALLIQMACTHAAAMTILAKFRQCS